MADDKQGKFKLIDGGVGDLKLHLSSNVCRNGNGHCYGLQAHFCGFFFSTISG